MKQRKVWLIKIGELKSGLRRLFVIALFLLSFLLVLLGRVDNAVINFLEKTLIGVSGPVMRVVEFPARAVHRAYTYVNDISHLYAENQQLQAENKQMMLLQNKVRSLEVENQLLTRLLNYIPPAEASFVSAKIIAESGDNFTHTLLIYIGEEKVSKGQIVLGDESVIGRIDSVSGHYAKVILVTDINSKIPVVIERTRTRGILSGDNTSMPELIFTRSTADIEEGDVIVTSGVGGVFPSGLPIGFVSSVHNGNIRIEMMSDLSRIEYVRIVDFGLSGQGEQLDNFMKSAEDVR